VIVLDSIGAPAPPKAWNRAARRRLASIVRGAGADRSNDRLAFARRVAKRRAAKGYKFVRLARLLRR
jgi:hypothetical protein